MYCIEKKDPLFNFYTKFYKDLKNKNFSSSLLSLFSKEIWNFYKYNKRDFLWRTNTCPYYVVVSEIMLQQTQTKRVEEKFLSFIKKFPDFDVLAHASQADVLAEWVGLGYNRRALALHGIAQKVVFESSGVLSDVPSVLQTYKGLGPATSASIVAFTYNKPTVFIETNIRAVYLHIFFHQEDTVPDVMLLPLIEATVDQKNPREWYYALMDYGVLLKKMYKNPSQKSKHYKKQSQFKGSDRQIRGALIRKLAKNKKLSFDELKHDFIDEEARVKKIIDALCQENFLDFHANYYRLKS